MRDVCSCSSVDSRETDTHSPSGARAGSGVTHDLLRPDLAAGAGAGVIERLPSFSELEVGRTGGGA